MSARLTPAAATRIRTSPGAGSGLATSARTRASASPGCGIVMAFMARAYGGRSRGPRGCRRRGSPARGRGPRPAAARRAGASAGPPAGRAGSTALRAAVRYAASSGWTCPCWSMPTIASVPGGASRRWPASRAAAGAAYGMSPPSSTVTSVRTAPSAAATPATGPPPGGSSRSHATGSRRLGRSGPTQTTDHSLGRFVSRASRTLVPPRSAAVLSPPNRRPSPPHSTTAVTDRPWSCATATGCHDGGTPWRTLADRSGLGGGLSAGLSAGLSVERPAGRTAWPPRG